MQKREEIQAMSRPGCQVTATLCEIVDAVEGVAFVQRSVDCFATVATSPARRAETEWFGRHARRRIPSRSGSYSSRPGSVCPVRSAQEPAESVRSWTAEQQAGADRLRRPLSLGVRQTDDLPLLGRILPQCSSNGTRQRQRRTSRATVSAFTRPPQSWTIHCRPRFQTRRTPRARRVS